MLFLKFGTPILNADPLRLVVFVVTIRPKIPGFHANQVGDDAFIFWHGRVFDVEEGAPCFSVHSSQGTEGKTLKAQAMFDPFPGSVCFFCGRQFLHGAIYIM